jgi:membrane protein
MVELLKKTFKKWNEDKAGRLSAALSYYAVFSLAPLLVVLIAAAGFIFGEAAVQGRLVAEIEGAVGRDAAEMIQTMIANTRSSEEGIIATIIGLALLIFAAGGLFFQLQQALDVIWNVQPKSGIGISGMARMRLGSFLLILVVVVLLLASMVASVVLAALSDMLADLLPGGTILFYLVNWLLSFGITALLFAVVFKLLPDVNLEWKDVWPGALLTALLFVIGKELIGLYLGFAAAGSTFGAAGSLVVLLLWIFYSAQIFLFGAAFTYVYAVERGRVVEPAPYAVFLSERERAVQGMPRDALVKAVEGDLAGPHLPEGRTPDRSRSNFLQEERSAGLLQKPRTPADRSATALAGITAALITFVSAALLRRRS